jgi:hypothetical protein
VSTRPARRCRFTSVVIRAHTVYIASGAYFTRTDPNLLEVALTE